LESNFKSIQKIQKHNPAFPVVAVPLFLGSGKVTQAFLSTEAQMYRKGDEGTSGTSAEIESVRLDDYIASSGIVPSVIKMDVDGSEFEVLEGALNCLRTHHPSLWLEVHPLFLKAQDKNWKKLKDTLEGLGYGINFYKDFFKPEREVSFHLWAEVQNSLKD
jgi:FkbM family methyltransferase